jgi:hypothetical protein
VYVLLHSYVLSMQCRLAAAHIRQCILAEVPAAVAVTWAAVDLDLIIEVSKPITLWH